jgi:colanic acid/amylovoran biosynthesis protein
MTSRGDRLAIGLLWHSLRCGNLGNGALTLSHISMLNQAAKAAKRSISIRVIENGGDFWYPPADDNVIDEVLTDPHAHVLPDTQLWRTVADCDVVLDVGNGDLFSDIYGADWFYLVTCHRIAALAQHVPLILSPQTIGPFKHASFKALARQLSMGCEKVFARDTESRLLLEELGVPGVEQCVDLAFRLPFEPQRYAPGRTIRLGFNVSGLLYDDARSKRFGFGLKADYLTLVRAVISMIQRRANVALILVPHVIGPGADCDVGICRQLSKEFNLQMAPEFTSPVEAKTFIAGLDLLVASRMHATIAAVSSGVPVIPLAYSRKFSGVMRSVDYPLVSDLLSEDVDIVVNAVEQALDNLSELRAAASNSSAIAQSRLERYQSYLTELLIDPPQRGACPDAPLEYFRAGPDRQMSA